MDMDPPPHESRSQIYVIVNSSQELEMDELQSSPPPLPPRNPTESPPPLPPRNPTEGGSDLIHSAELQKIFARKIFGVLLWQIFLTFIVKEGKFDGIVISKEFNPLFGLGFFVLLILLMAFYIPTQKWINCSKTVSLVIGVFSLCIACIFPLMANLAQGDSLTFHSVLAMFGFTCLGLFLFTFSTDPEFNIFMIGTRLILMGKILAILILLFLERRSLETCVVVCFSLCFELYIILLVKNMIGTGWCKRECGCGIGITEIKSSKEWPLAVLQLYFCIMAVLYPSCFAFMGFFRKSAQS